MQEWVGRRRRPTTTHHHGFGFPSPKSKHRRLPGLGESQNAETKGPFPPRMRHGRVRPGSVLAPSQIAHQLRERQEGPELAGLLLHRAPVRQRLSADPPAAPVLPHLLRQRHEDQDGRGRGRLPEGGWGGQVGGAGLQARGLQVDGGLQVDVSCWSPRICRDLAGWVGTTAGASSPASGAVARGRTK